MAISIANLCLTIRERTYSSDRTAVVISAVMSFAGNGGEGWQLPLRELTIGGPPAGNCLRLRRLAPPLTRESGPSRRFLGGFRYDWEQRGVLGHPPIPGHSGCGPLQ